MGLGPTRERLVDPMPDSSHDPLCPEYGCDYGDCFSQSFSDAFCQCDLIAKVRADEKAKWTHTCPDNNCCNGGPN